MRAALQRVSCACILIPALASAGCGTLQYYAQSATGQIDLMRHARPVERVLDDPDTPEEVRRGLALVQDIRDFARSAMRLPDHGSYRRYVELHRAFVVWNVFVAPELSLAPKIWCYPFAGCLSYRGYFDEARARRYADTLRREGMDVYVAGVAAYSTLGWFDDPVLDTMLRRPPAELARLLLHELAHQKLYFHGDPDFNEAFADTIAGIGVDRWLAGRPAVEVARFRDEQKREDAFHVLILDARAELEAVYRSDRGDAAKRAAKVAIGRELQSRYREVNRDRGSGDIYAEWFNGEVNNARIAAVSTYRGLVPDFLRVYDACARNLDIFYAHLARLGHCSPAARRHWLQAARIDDSC